MFGVASPVFASTNLEPYDFSSLETLDGSVVNNPLSPYKDPKFMSSPSTGSQLEPSPLWDGFNLDAMPLPPLEQTDLPSATLQNDAALVIGLVAAKTLLSSQQAHVSIAAPELNPESEQLINAAISKVLAEKKPHEGASSMSKNEKVAPELSKDSPSSSQKAPSSSTAKPHFPRPQKTASAIIDSFIRNGRFERPSPKERSSLLEMGATLLEYRFTHKSLFSDTLRNILFYFPNLKSLSLTYSNLKNDCIKQLGNYEALTSLDISYNTEITTEGFSHLSKPTSLESLTLEGCQITDNDLKYLAPLEKLTCLNLSNCKITGEGLAHLRAKNLQVVNLCSTSLLTDCVWNHLEKFAELRNLNVDKCYALENPNWACFYSWKHLQYLQASHLSMNDDAIMNLSNCEKSLQSLHFAGGIGDLGLSIIASFTNFRRLIFGSNDMGCISTFTDDGLKTLINSPKLEVLMLRRCPNITSKGLKNLSAMKTLKQFSCDDKLLL